MSSSVSRSATALARVDQGALMLFGASRRACHDSAPLDPALFRDLQLVYHTEGLCPPRRQLSPQSCAGVAGSCAWLLNPAGVSWPGRSCTPVCTSWRTAIGADAARHPGIRGLHPEGTAVLTMTAWALGILGFGSTLAAALILFNIVVGGGVRLQNLDGACGGMTRRSVGSPLCGRSSPATASPHCPWPC